MSLLNLFGTKTPFEISNRLFSVLKMKNEAVVSILDQPFLFLQAVCDKNITPKNPRVQLGLSFKFVINHNFVLGLKMPKSPRKF